MCGYLAERGATCWFRQVIAAQFRRDHGGSRATAARNPSEGDKPAGLGAIKVVRRIPHLVFFDKDRSDGM